MINEQINRTRLDLQAIIDCLELIVEKENMKISTEINPNGFFGKKRIEDHSQNISLAKECQECLQFIHDALPRFIADYKEMTPVGCQIRKFKSISDLQKYRTELARVRDCIELFIRFSRMNPNMTDEDTALGNECLNKLKQANSAMYKIK